MALTQYNFGNNIEAVEVKVPFSDTDTTITLEDGQGDIFKDENGDALTDFLITVEKYTGTVVTKREVIKVATVSLDVLQGITRSVEYCVQDDSADIKEQTNDPLDFGSDNVFVSVRKTASQESDIRNEITNQNSDSNLVNLSDTQTITGDKTDTGLRTFANDKARTTSDVDPIDDLSFGHKAWIERAIQTAGAISSTAKNYRVGEDFESGKFGYLSQQAENTGITGTQNIGDFLENARVAIKVYGGEANGPIDCDLGVVGFPVDLEFSLETQVGGEPSGTLANASATGSLQYEEINIGASPVLGTVTYDILVNNALDYTGYTNDTQTYSQGLCFSTKEKTHLSSISTQSSCSGTRCRLLDSSGTLLQTATISSNIATFDYILSKGLEYRVEVDNSGSSYTRASLGGISFPVSLDSIEIVGGSSDGSTFFTTYYNIETITTTEATYENLGLTKDEPYRLIINKTADDITSSNYYTIGTTDEIEYVRNEKTFNGISYQPTTYKQIPIYSILFAGVVMEKTDATDSSKINQIGPSDSIISKDEFGLFNLTYDDNQSGLIINNDYYLGPNKTTQNPIQSLFPTYQEFVTNAGIGTILFGQSFTITDNGQDYSLLTSRTTKMQVYFNSASPDSLQLVLDVSIYDSTKTKIFTCPDLYITTSFEVIYDRVTSCVGSPQLTPGKQYSIVYEIKELNSYLGSPGLRIYKTDSNVYSGGSFLDSSLNSATGDAYFNSTWVDYTGVRGGIQPTAGDNTKKVGKADSDTSIILSNYN